MNNNDFCNWTRKKLVTHNFRAIRSTIEKMSRRTYTKSESNIKDEIQSMLLSEIRDKIYEYRKRALINPTRENVSELKKLIREIKEELDL